MNILIKADDYYISHIYKTEYTFKIKFTFVCRFMLFVYIVKSEYMKYHTLCIFDINRYKIVTIYICIYRYIAKWNIFRKFLFYDTFMSLKHCSTLMTILCSFAR